MYAFGLCIDQQYLVPSLAALCGLTDSLTPPASAPSRFSGPTNASAAGGRPARPPVR